MLHRIREALFDLFALANDCPDKKQYVEEKQHALKEREKIVNDIKKIQKFDK